MLRIIEFYPPMSGIEGDFNTFRLGLAWSKRLSRGDRVLLIDKKQYALMGVGEVLDIHVGKLREMSTTHGCHNHNQKHLPQDGAGERVVAAMIKRYGPNKCSENSNVTVLYIRRIDDGDDANVERVLVREIQG